MSPVIVKSVSDAVKLKAGDQYIIDVWPPADQDDQQITQAMIDEERQLQAAVEKHLANPKSDNRNPRAVRRVQ